jgi:hypothetical protein
MDFGNDTDAAEIAKLVEDCKKDPTINVWGVCDASNFLAETYMERYESLYIKIVEMTNVLIAKGASERRKSYVDYSAVHDREICS